MKRKTVSAITLTLLLTSMLMLALTFNIECVIANIPVRTPQFWLLTVEKLREFETYDGQRLISELLKYPNWNNSTECTSHIHLLSEYTSEEVSDEIKPFLIGYPERTSVQREITGFLGQAMPGDIIVVYIECHGTYHHLMGIDVSYSELNNWLSLGNLPLCYVTVIIESCRSGSSIMDGEGGDLGPNHNVLCGCMSNEGCSGVGDYMFFSHLLTEGFSLCEDSDNDGWVSPKEVFIYAKPLTEQWIWDAFQWDQRPVSYYGQVEGGVPLVQRDIAKPCPDMPPLIIMLFPKNVTYMTNSIPLTFTVNEPVSWIGYSLDQQLNMTITGNMTLTDLSEGSHSITVYASDISGNMGASSRVFFTVRIPKPPTANFTWSPYLPKVGELVIFDASSSTPDGGTIMEYEWNFGDGKYATGLIMKHTYSGPGSYIVTLNVTDSEGLWDVEQKPIQVVQLHGPKAEFTITPETAKIGELVKFDASISLSGWNGTHNMPITEYRWDFGDGNRTTTSTPIIHHRFSGSGIYYITLTVYAPGATPETDSTTLRVTVITIPVGGYSISIHVPTKTEPVLPYIALIATLTAILTKIRPKTKRKR